jgi:hypothetical protein
LAAHLSFRLQVRSFVVTLDIDGLAFSVLGVRLLFCEVLALGPCILLSFINSEFQLFVFAPGIVRDVAGLLLQFLLDAVMDAILAFFLFGHFVFDLLQ